MSLTGAPRPEEPTEDADRETLDDRFSGPHGPQTEAPAAKPIESNGGGREDPTQTHGELGAGPRAGSTTSKKVDLASATDDELFRLIPTALLERFRDISLLGKGGMGVVFKARDVRLDRLVAIKLLVTPGAYMGDEFLREAQAQARLQHENACEVYEAGIADRVVPFIVMRYVDGPPLSQLREAMTLEDKVFVVAKVALALHEAHRIGLVHRDVKPSNIMVERGEDGMWKPYIMDFGLAREAGEGGNTVTGTVVGTPAYMAPEQAAGLVRSLDRRTDVYSLGATLFSILVGRPPFKGETILDVLHQVKEADAPSLRQLDSNVPIDIDLIVMKCLERQAGARYDSARALAEDLQRYLDGEPVLARQPSIPYRLAKFVRRNKRAVTIAAVVFMTTSISVAVWLYNARLAALRVELARELAEDVKEMELLMRNAHTMPLHDVGREHRILRGRLEKIQSRMNAAGELGVGPGNYALGRGELALQEPKKALEHLRAAEAAGYHTSGLDYALGLTLSDLYAAAFEETKRIQNKAAREQRIAELKAQYETPAINHLRAALGGTTESRVYVEALLAFHEGRTDDALEKARASYTEAPWFYEAKRLEGDILFARGRPYGHDAAFKYDKMKPFFDEAAVAYAVASDHGRSDTKTHAAECELWTQYMMADNAHGTSMRPNFDKAKAACAKAIQAGSPDGRAYVRRAFLYNCFSWWVVANGGQDEQPEAALRDAVEQAEEALRQNKSDPMAPYVAGGVFRARALYERKKGTDMREALRRSIEGYQAALQLDPDFVWAYSELCNVFTMKGADDARRGEDPTASLERAVELCDRAMVLDPTFIYAKNNRLSAAERLAEHLLEKGESPDVAVDAALPVLDTARKLEPSLRTIPYVRARLELLRARYALDAGQNLTATLTRIQQAAEDLQPHVATWPSAAGVSAELSIVEARCRLAQNQDPSAALQKARMILDNLIAKDASWSISHRSSRAEVELVAFEWSAHSGKPDRTRLVEALRPLQGVDDEPRNDPNLFTTLAKIHHARAALDAKDKKTAEDDMTLGLRYADAALASNAHGAEALVAKANLLLLRAELSKEEDKQRAIARSAVAAFRAAFEANPLKKRTHGTQLDEAMRITEREPSKQAH